jgi:hypothetical protein
MGKVKKTGDVEYYENPYKVFTSQGKKLREEVENETKGQDS